MADGLPFGFDAALLGLGFRLDDDLGLLGLGRGFHRGPPLGLDALGLGQRGLGHGAVLRFLHRGLGFALARLAQLIRFGLLDLQRRPAARRCPPAPRSRR